ncbi:MAG: winged helix-turn-helix transcriptional regulator [Thermoplasmatota archaeon]
MTQRTSALVTSIIAMVALSILIQAPSAECIPLIDAEEGFFLEVLLNRDDIRYDLGPLQELADEGLVTRTELDLYYPAADGPDDGFPFRWGSQEYYIFRSHTINDLAVMVYETDNSILSMMTGSNVDLEGLSVALMVPTRVETVEYEQSKLQMPIPANTTVDISVIPFMEELGYRGGYMEGGINSGGFVKWLYFFTRGNITMNVVLGDDDPNTTIENEWSFQVIGRNITLDDRVEEDAKTLLEFIGVDPSIYDTGSLGLSNETMDAVIPDVDVDLSSMNWGEALGVELRFLRELSVIKGLSDEDIEGIASSARTGAEGLNDIILFHGLQWRSIFGLVTDQALGLWPTPLVGTIHVPEKVITTVPRDEGRKIPRGTLILISGTAVSGAIVIGFFLIFSRLKTRSLQNNANRSRIIDLIGREPGIHFRKISRDLDLKQGVLAYHLNVLEKHEIIKSIQDGNNRRFYLFDEKIVPCLTLNEVQESIIRTIYDRPGISQSAISAEIGHSKALISYHIRILRGLGIVNVLKSGGVTECYLREEGLVISTS